MRPLVRKSLFTEQVSDDRRLDQLERRFVEAQCCLMPTIYSRSVSHDIVAGEVYGSGILWGHSANVNGLADSIFHANDRTDGLGDWFIFDGDVVQIFGPPRVVAFEFGVTVQGADIDPTPPNYLQLFINHAAPNLPGLREWIWEGEELVTKASQSSPTFRISGLEWVDPTEYDPDTNGRNIHQFQGVIVQECGGAAGDQDITVLNMWYTATTLTYIEDVEDVHA